MCGIAGIARNASEPVDRSLLEKMSARLTHRGPDDRGIYLGAGVGLGFCRLSIIDLAGGKQPMASEDGRYQIIFNGEIYNYRELRAGLEARGIRFQTASDTEVLLRLLIEKKENALADLRGMFALALWDQQERSLLLARDRFGKKPLVYAETPSGLVFASEIQALLQHPEIAREIDPEAIDLYLTYQYIPSPRTIFRGIRKLPPASWLRWKPGQCQVQPYWDLSFFPKTSLSFEEAKVAFMKELKEAVRLRMISDVPIGAFLSGGHDSSVVVGLMSELSSQPVKTFSIGFEEAEFSELPHARTVAQHFGCEHHELIVKPDIEPLMPLLARHYGEPFADSSAVPSYYVARETRQHVTVALNGDGGDEMLAGYPRYQAMKFWQVWGKIPQALRVQVSAFLRRFSEGSPPLSKLWRLKRLFELGDQDPRTRYIDTLCFFRENRKRALYTKAFAQRVESVFAPDLLNQWLRSFPSPQPKVDAYLYADLHTYLPDCLMVKVDIASMANGLEARSPFLDHVFAEFCARLPDDWKLRGLTQTKYILKEATRGWLPESIRTRGKQGFALPVGKWMRGPLRHSVETAILSDKAMQRGWFERKAVKQVLEEHASAKVDHTYRLWALWMLEIWAETVYDARG